MFYLIALDKGVAVCTHEDKEEEVLIRVSTQQFAGLEFQGYTSLTLDKYTRQEVQRNVQEILDSSNELGTLNLLKGDPLDQTCPHGKPLCNCGATIPHGVECVMCWVDSWAYDLAAKRFMH